MTAPATGIVLGGRYRLQERIASGGMGTVWAAEDETLHRRVAVKLLNEGLFADERFTERFRREARAAAGLSHPAIAGVFDYGEDDGRPYIVMELIDGETLADRLQRFGRLDPEETARVGAAVADALAVAHQQGLVHRDIKPANIMFDRAGAVRVLDFGISAPLEGTTGLTATGTVMGTSRYISPEQAEGERATAASDMYSLGVVLYEAITGDPPFVRETPVATALAHIHERARPIRDVRPGTPLEIADAVQESLSKDATLRPSPRELAARLRQAQPLAAATIPLAAGGDTDGLDVPAEAPTLPKPRAEAASPAEISSRTMPLWLRVPLGSVSGGGSRRDRRLWLVGATLVALLIVIVGAFVSGSARAVKAPHLVGLTRQEAKAKADQLGFMPVFRLTTSDAPAGTVVGQRPYPGKKVPQGIPILVLVSRGPAAPPPSPAPSPSQPPGHEKHGKHDHGHGNGDGNGGGGD